MPISQHTHPIPYLVLMYAGSRDGNDPAKVEATKHFAARLADHGGFGLVFGAGSVGVMNSVANEFLDRNRVVVGVTPHYLMRQREGALRDLPYLYIIDPIPDDDGQEAMDIRKTSMRRLADGIAVTPGGDGTRDEFAGDIILHRLGIHNKKPLFLNVNGHFDADFAAIEGSVTTGFSPAGVKSYLIANDPDTAADHFITQRQAWLKTTVARHPVFNPSERLSPRHIPFIKHVHVEGHRVVIDMTDKVLSDTLPRSALPSVSPYRNGT